MRRGVALAPVAELARVAERPMLTQEDSGEVMDSALASMRPAMRWATATVLAVVVAMVAVVAAPAEIAEAGGVAAMTACPPGARVSVRDVDTRMLHSGR